MKVKTIQKPEKLLAVIGNSNFAYSSKMASQKRLTLFYLNERIEERREL